MKSPALETAWKALAEAPGKSGTPRPLEKLARPPQRGSLPWRILYTSAPQDPIGMPAGEVTSLTLAQAYRLSHLADEQAFHSLLLEDLASDVGCISFCTDEEGGNEGPSTLAARLLFDELNKDWQDNESSTLRALDGVYPRLVRFEFPFGLFRKPCPSAPKRLRDGIRLILDWKEFMAFSQSLSELPQGSGLVVRLATFHNRGADAVTELALLLASAAQMGRSSVRASTCEWRLATSSALLSSAAKLRAARLLLDTARAQGMKLPDQTTLGAETSLVELSHLDTWTNLIRNTTAVAGALMGRCESLLVHAHDRPVARPNSFGHRLARNMVHIAIKESHLTAFDDPLAGSFALESQTHELAKAAWEFFLRIEDAGGMEADLTRDDGLIASAIKASRAKMIREERHRRPGLIGASEFPDLTGALAGLNHHECPEALFSRAWLPSKMSLTTSPEPEAWTEPLMLSMVFGSLQERLRALPEWSTRSPSENKLCPYRIVCKGALAALSGRLSWTENAMSAGGFYRDDEDKNAPLQIFIASDETYRSELGTWLNERHQDCLTLVAGKLPPELESEAKRNGLFASFYLGCDLAGLHESLIDTLGRKGGGQS